MSIILPVEKMATKRLRGFLKLSLQDTRKARTGAQASGRQESPYPPSHADLHIAYAAHKTRL